VTLTDGSPELPLPDESCDRFVSNYVLDLLPEDRIRRVIAEAGRVLVRGGRLCLVSLTFGQGPASKAVIAVWKALHRARPALVGGCRPIEIGQYVSAGAWEVLYRATVVSWVVPSEVWVAKKP
jgi:ubiquinone/menaquinone biosynthesis C-methylase UbiE